MSMRVTVRYNDVYKALEPLRGLKLLGVIPGPPTSRIPLAKIYESLIKSAEVGREEYRGTRITAARVDDETFIVCHFGLEEPDDFCVVVGGEKAWDRILEAADKLSRLTNESYTLTIAAILHSLQGIIHGEEGEVEEITDPDQVIEELLTWLPEYIAVVD